MANGAFLGDDWDVLRTRAFTLLELCLAIAIGVLLLGLVVPSVAGLFSEQKRRASFDRLEELVVKAQKLSVEERRGFVLVWEEGAVVLQPDQPVAEDAGREWPRIGVTSKEAYLLERPAAMEQKPVQEWPFWRGGTCEPVIVRYEGPEGRWRAEFNALTCRAVFSEEEGR